MSVKENRRYLILREVVDRYIKTGRPVSSREIVEEYGHPWSPATVRNELAALEREGYLYKPSPSSGRVPTAKGFRYFARWILDLVGEADDGAARPAPLPRWTYELLLARSVSDLFRAAASSLAGAVGQVGFVVSPPPGRLRVLRALLTRLRDRLALFHPLVELGLAVECVVPLSRPYVRRDFAKAEEILDDLIGGRPLGEAGAVLHEIESWHGSPYRLATEVLTTVAEERPRLHFAGLEHLMRGLTGPALRAAVRLLDDGWAFVELVFAARGVRRGVDVRVGDLPAEGLAGFALVSADFLDGLGVLGVFGPVWLDYAKAIAAVRSVAGVLSALGRGTGPLAAGDLTGGGLQLQ